MRRARTVQLPSARNLCVFCASRQLTLPASNASVTSTQRRHLNSSSKAPFNEEAQLYKEDKPAAAAPLRPMSQAERMRQLLQKQYAAKPAPPPQVQQPQVQGHGQGNPFGSGSSSWGQPSASSRNPRRSADPFGFPPRSQSQSQFGARQPLQGQSWQGQGQGQGQARRPPQRGGNLFDDMGVGRNQDRHTGNANERYSQNRRTYPQSGNRYNVNMGARPPQVDIPEFGAANLRRRAEPSTNPFAQADTSIGTSTHRQPSNRPPPLRPQLDQDELNRLLGNNSTHTGRGGSAYERASFQGQGQGQGQGRRPLKCFNCGEEGHRGNECPDRQNYNYNSPSSQYRQQRQQQSPESVADAAEAFIRRKGAELQESSQSPGYLEEEQRRKAKAAERRASRFKIDDEPVETRNRYEEPERRQRGSFEKRSRRVRRSDEEFEEEQQARYVNKAERKRLRDEAKKRALLERAEPIPIVIPEYISVANLASLLRLRVEDFVRKLEDLGFEEVQNDHILNAEHAGLIAQEYNFEPIVLADGQDGDLYSAPAVDAAEYAKLPARPPVVTIMGHVDHGKTTVLDYIRSSSVAASEFGGITQHIGAFSVSLPSQEGKKITFLDTPGHSAFETMRARGANVTDIVVLVVAADDSVMPQTVEAIKHARAAGVPLIVAINKMDKPGADPEKVKADLGRHGVEVEDYGGDVQTVLVSGKTGDGIPELEEAIVLLSEVLDHRADPTTAVEGWVLEGSTKNRGRVATVLVRRGTLKRGDVLVAGQTWARVRTLRDENGTVIEAAPPGTPVEVDGWREQPVAGDEVLQAADEQHASDVSDLRVEKSEKVRMARDIEAVNEARRLEAERRAAEEALEEGETLPDESVEKKTGPATISFIIKADVSGSCEAVCDSLNALGTAEVRAHILRSGVGAPSEFDVQHASDAGGHIVNFNTAIPNNIAAMAAAAGVKILDSNIIYRVVEEVKALLSEKLPPKITQRVTGEAEIAATFEIGLGGKKKLLVAGSKVRNGVVEKGGRVKVLRGEEVVYDGTISSLKSSKKDVDSMRKDTECGIAFDGWEEFEVGDKVQAYEEKVEKRSL